MSQRAKLIASVRNNPKDVRYEDACTVAEWLGFIAKRGKGSHTTFLRQDEPDGLNFQNRGGKILPYQARQLIDMIDKYWRDES